MILLLRALVRLLGFLLLIALALVGLGFALAALLGDELGVQLDGSAVSRLRNSLTDTRPLVSRTARSSTGGDAMNAAWLRTYRSGSTGCRRWW